MLGPADDGGVPWIGFGANYENGDPLLVASPAAFGETLRQQIATEGAFGPIDAERSEWAWGYDVDQSVLAIRTPLDISPALAFETRDEGQHGLALQYFEPALAGCEFGVFWTHLHSRLPVLSTRSGSPPGQPAGDHASSVEYFREFPDDLDTLEGTFSYALDRPLEVDEVELLFSALTPLVIDDDGLLYKGPGTYTHGDPLSTMHGFTAPDQPVSAYVGMPGRVYQLADLATLEPQPNGTWRFPAGGEHQVVVPTGFVFVPDGELPDLYELMGQLPVASFGADGQARLDLSTGSGRIVVNVFDAVPTTKAGDASPRIKAASAYSVFSGAAEFNQRTDRDFVSLTASYGF